MKTLMVIAALCCATAALAAPPRDVSSGTASGKVSMSDLHFSTRTDAAAHCDKAPVTTAADGSFACSSVDHAINTKGTGTAGTSKPGNKHPDLMR